MKNKKGFTLVELLAVIAILAILVIIALPNVINMYNKAQKETFLTEAKKVYTEAEKKYISSSITGNTIKTISSENSSKLDMTGKKLQYCVILNNIGKVTDMKVSNGKWIASLNGKAVEDLTIDDLEEGNLDDYKCSQYTPNVPKATNCTFDGELKQGAEYVNGQYTYRYMQSGNYNNNNTLSWINSNNDGWGVQLTDKTSTDPVTSKVCTYINNKPVVSTDYMFYKSQAKVIDLNSFNTSNVTNMSYMFSNSQAITISGLNKFNTSKVTTMTAMFRDSQATSLDLSSFDTSNVTTMELMFQGSQASILDLSSFDTSKVTDMSSMFHSSKATSIDVSNFDTSKVIDMGSMFSDIKTTTINVSNFDTSNVEKMNSMFSFNTFTSIDLSNFNTRKVTNMSNMFWSIKISTLDLSSFDTSNVTNMYGMFYSSPNLKTIYASDKFVTTNVTESSKMFQYCVSLVGGSNTAYNSGKVDKTYARIDTASTPGYFTKK